MNLTHLTNQVVSQMLEDDKITACLSTPLVNKINKAGIATVLALTTFMGSGFAHADSSLKATVGMSALVGLLNNGSRPPDVPQDCNVRGTNGYIVGGAGAAGAYAMNQVGGGNGKKVLTVAGGFLAATAAQSVENNRIRNECLRQQAQNYNSNYNSNVHYNNNNRGYHLQPVVAQPPQAVYSRPAPNYPRYPQAQANSGSEQTILYATQNYGGHTTYVHVGDSPGVSSLRGQQRGEDPRVSPELQQDIEQSLNNMVRSYQRLEQQSNNYLNVSRGRPANSDVRYANPRDYVERENQQLQQALSNYAEDRASFAQVADNAAMSGYNLSAYRHALNYITPPPALKVAYGGRNINRFSTIKTNYANR